MKPLLFISLLSASFLFLSSPAYSQTVSRADLVRDVRIDLERLLAQANPELKVTTLFQRTDLLVGEGKVSLQLDVEPEYLAAGRHPIQVRVLVNGQLEKQIKVMALLKRIVEVPVVRHSMKRGSLVTSRDIKWQRIEMVRAIEGLVKDEEDVIGKVALRSVREGIPLRSKWFDEPLAVDRGDRVNVKLIQGGLIINTTAVALGKGRVGDMIQLRNPSSHVRYEARVSAPGQARVQTW